MGVMAPVENGTAEAEQVEKVEGSLQAVLLCDWGCESFAPLSTGKDGGSALAPVCGVPALDYWLHFYREHGVRQAILVVSSDSAKECVDKAWKKWKRNNFSTFDAHVFVAPGAATVGDALRAIDKEKLIMEEFILATVDNVPCGDAQAAINAHLDRRKKNKNVMISRFMTESTAKDSPLNTYNILVESNSEEILRYYTSWTKPDIPASVAKPFLKAGVDFSFDMKYGVRDCFDICAPGAVQILTDSFDVFNRTQLAQNIITSRFDADLSSDGVYISWKPETLQFYNVANPRTRYATCKTLSSAVSKHLKKPAANPIPAHLRHVFGAQVDQNGQMLFKNLDKGSWSMAGTNVEAKATGYPESEKDAKPVINASYLGNKCTVCQKSTVARSLVGSNVTIGANVELEECVIGNGVTIGNDVTLSCDTIVGPGVAIADGVKHEVPVRIEACSADESDKAIVGEGGVGRRMEYTIAATDTAAGMYCADEIWDVECISADPIQKDWDALKDFLKDQGKPSEDVEMADQGSGADAFTREAVEMIEEGSQGAASDMDGLVMELKCLRSAHHKSCDEAVAAVMPTIFTFWEKAAVEKSLKSSVEKWAPVISGFFPKAGDDRVRATGMAVSEIERACRAKPDVFGANKFQNILFWMYEAEDRDGESCLPEEAILEWHAKSKERYVAIEAFVKATTGLIEHLQADSESEEEDSDEE